MAQTLPTCPDCNAGYQPDDNYHDRSHLDGQGATDAFTDHSRQLDHPGRGTDGTCPGNPDDNYQPREPDQPRRSFDDHYPNEDQDAY